MTIRKGVSHCGPDGLPCVENLSMFTSDLSRLEKKEYVASLHEAVAICNGNHMQSEEMNSDHMSTLLHHVKIHKAIREHGSHEVIMIRITTGEHENFNFHNSLCLHHTSI